MVHFHCMICTIGITKRLFQLLFFFLRGKDLLKKFNRPSGDHQSISFTCISHRLKLARALIPRRCLSFFSYTCKDFFLFFFFFFSYKSALLSFFFFFCKSIQFFFFDIFSKLLCKETNRHFKKNRLYCISLIVSPI